MALPSWTLAGSIDSCNNKFSVGSVILGKLSTILAYYAITNTAPSALATTEIRILSPNMPEMILDDKTA